MHVFSTEGFLNGYDAPWQILVMNEQFLSCTIYKCPKAINNRDQTAWISVQTFKIYLERAIFS
jgi:hypothetical protein